MPGVLRLARHPVDPAGQKGETLRPFDEDLSATGSGGSPRKKPALSSRL